MLPENEIRTHIDRLAALVAEQVPDARIAAAYKAVPRHRFVAQGFIDYDTTTNEWQARTPEDTTPQAWFETIYSNRVLMLSRGTPREMSSSSEPVLMAQMLHALDVQPGQRVLEIGTGSGYNAGLLAHLVAPEGQVDTIDIQARLTERAAPILQQLAGDRVRVHTGDGLLGVPQHAPYDRIIATAGHTAVPPAWVAQLAVGGKLLLNMGDNGGLLLAEKTAAGVSGHFIEAQGYFMPLADDAQANERRLLDVPYEDVSSLGFHMFVGYALPGVRPWPDDYAPGKAKHEMAWRFSAANGRAQVVFDRVAGETRLRSEGAPAFTDALLALLSEWQALGRPAPGDFKWRLAADGTQSIRVGERQFLI